MAHPYFTVGMNYVQVPCISGYVQLWNQLVHQRMRHHSDKVSDIHVLVYTMHEDRLNGYRSLGAIPNDCKLNKITCYTHVQYWVPACLSISSSYHCHHNNT